MYLSTPIKVAYKFGGILALTSNEPTLSVYICTRSVSRITDEEKVLFSATNDVIILQSHHASFNDEYKMGEPSLRN